MSEAGVNAETTETEPMTQEPKPPKPSPRLFPPTWVWFVMGLCVAAATFIRVRDQDHAYANVCTALFGLLGCGVLGIWFLFFSGYRLMLRVSSVLAVVAAVVLFFRAYKIEEVSAELVPKFVPRSQPAPDEALASPQSSGSADLSVTSPDDFPQFLGPRRDADLPDVMLDHDWTTNPPRELWKQPIGAGWSAFASVNGFAVTMEQRGPEELVTCYEVDTGQLVWSQATPTRHDELMGGVGPRSTPTIHGGNVYALGATGVLQCLNGETGEPIWTKALREVFQVSVNEELRQVPWGRSASPLVVEDLVVVPAGGELTETVSLAAFHRETGELAWQAGDRQISYSSPTLLTINGRKQIVIVSENNVTGHEVATGKVLWEVDWAGHSNSDVNASQPIVFGDGNLLLAKGYGEGARALTLSDISVDTFAISELWRNDRVLKAKFSSIVVRDGHAYALSDGILECVDLTTGDRRWKRGRYGHGQVLGVGDALLVQAEDGSLALVSIDPTAFNELARVDALDGKTWTNPCLVGDKLLIRNATEAACLRVARRGD